MDSSENIQVALTFLADFIFIFCAIRYLKVIGYIASVAIFSYAVLDLLIWAGIVGIPLGFNLFTVLTESTVNENGEWVSTISSQALEIIIGATKVFAACALIHISKKLITSTCS
ncbi:MAG: hypothetical protein K6L73_09395 [Cellvibrionaceae bacterium]